MLEFVDAHGRDSSVLPVRADPELGVDLVLGDHLAAEDVAHEEVVVHGLSDDLGDRRGVEFEEGVVLRFAGLRGSSEYAAEQSVAPRTFLLRETRRRVTSPNWEK